MSGAGACRCDGKASSVLPSAPHVVTDDPAAELQAALGMRFQDEGFLSLALTHRSYAYEQGGLPTNERLEFLGDAVLGLVVTDLLFQRFPELPEGQLARLRAATVNTGVLAEIAMTLGIGDAVRLGRGEEATGGRKKASILADTLEAVLGALYLDCGLEAVGGVIERLTGPRIGQASVQGAGLDYKTSLQELVAARLEGAPAYQLSEEGPDHDKRFTAVVFVGQEPCGTGHGRSKKEAEQAAAREAYTAFLVQQEPSPGK